ncbi:MAG: hypothetical protein FWG16_04715 [Micrococcales bacterium]|nr:hypothetical protein [Micrococcales bacterium]
MSLEGLGGFHQHTSAVGELVTSLYTAGSAAFRSGPDDPSPGVESMHGVMGRLDTKGLTHVISLDAAQGLAVCQSKCPLARLAKVAQEHSVACDLPTGRGSVTVGSAILRGLIPADRVDWVEVLTTSGLISRHEPGAWPSDAFIVAASIHLTS